MQSTLSAAVEDNVSYVKYRVNWDRVRQVDRVSKQEQISSQFLTSIYSDVLPGKSPLGIVFKTPTLKELNEWLGELPNYIQGLFTFNGNPLLLEDYQTNWINDRSRFRLCAKSRRTGLSLAAAVEACAEAQLTGASTDWTFLSYTLEEAINKIDYARMVYDSLPTKFKRKKMRDRRQSLEFHDTYKGTITRLLSHAQRAPRGGGGNVLLDEFAHFQWAKKILEAATACILTGQGRLSIISTPFGEGDPFHEITIDERRGGVYSQHKVYWWECPWLCNDIVLAKKIAHKMSTRERVERFGTAALKQVYISYLDKDAFKQEMEVVFLSELYRFFSRDLIMQCVYPWGSQRFVDASGQVQGFDASAFDEHTSGSNVAEHGWLDYNDIPQPSAYKIVRLYQDEPRVNFFMCDTVEELAGMVMSGAVGFNLIGGHDVGRTIDPSTFVILEEVRTSDDVILQIERFSIEWKNIKMPEQKQYLIHVMNLLRSLKLGIDAQGIGRGPTEDLEMMFPGRVFAKYFSADSKAEMSKNIKARMQAYTYAMAESREVVDHFHSIRQTVSQANRTELFHPDKTAKHHADLYWCRAIASITGTPATDSRSKLSVDSSQQFANSRMFDQLIPGIFGNRVPRIASGNTGRVVLTPMSRVSLGFNKSRQPPLGIMGLPMPSEVL